MKKVKNKIDKNKTVYIQVAILVIVAIIITVVFALNKASSDKDNANDNNTIDDSNNVVDEIGENRNQGVTEDKEVGELFFTNTSLVSTEDGATLKTLVTNSTSEDIEVRVFDIIIKDKDGNVLVTSQGYVGGVVPGKESREIVSNFDINLSRATDVEYKLVK